MTVIADDPPARSDADEKMSPGRQFHDLFTACRPGQWTKNIFVLAPILFSEKPLAEGDLARSVVATVCFCWISSAVYITNDLIDRAGDRTHPRKSKRPIAAGRIGLGRAIGLAATLVLVATAIGAAVLPRAFLGYASAFVVNSLAYCFWFKRMVILDVIVISLGFVLRLLAGCAAIGVVPSNWIIVCGFNLALVLGFGKRRAEVSLPGVGNDYRPALLGYNPGKCDILLACSTAVCLVSYTLYTVAPETVALHRTNHLVFTTPIVAYGLFRYLFKVQEGAGDGPSEILIGDPVFLVTGLFWGLSVLAILAAR